MTQHSGCDFRLSTLLIHFDCSYQSGVSSSYMLSNELASIKTDSGGNVTGRFIGEICTLKSSTSALTFTYNASRTFACTFLMPIPQPTRLAVLMTDPSVTNELYPLGARGILGYGVNAPPTAPANASLIPSFLPCVNYISLSSLSTTVNQRKLYQRSLRH